MKIIHITDTHLFNDPNKTKDHINHYDTFHQCIDLGIAQSPDLVIATGDFVDDVDSVAYQYVAKGLAKFSCPCHFVLGNHDEDPLLAKRCLTGKNLSSEQHILTPHWQIILLSSHWTGEIAGYLDHSQLELLSTCLSQHKLPTLIALHHNPTDMNNIAYEPINLNNAHEFFNTIAPFPQVKLCIYGHVHQAYYALEQGIPFYATPSTCRQNVPDVIGFIKDPIAPGIREVILEDNGDFQTRVLRPSS
jgi:Icc protein